MDFSANFVAPLIVGIASGEPIIVLAGTHVGCYELFANESIRSIADLKGKTIGVPGLESSHHMFASVIVAHIGLDPVNDIRWVTPNARIALTGRALRGGKDRRVPRLSAGAAGSPRSRHRACGRRHHRGPPLVAIFLLCARRQQRIRAQISSRDQTRNAGHPQSHRPLRHRTGTCRAAPRRWWFYCSLRLCAAVAERASLRQMARIRRRGYVSGITRFGCTKWGSSSRARRRSSPTAPIGAS